MKGLPLAYQKDMQEDKEGAIDALGTPVSASVCRAISSIFFSDSVESVLDSAAANEEQNRSPTARSFPLPARFI